MQSGLQAIVYLNLQYLPQLQIIYLNFNLDSNGLVTCIIPDTFVSSPIRLMIPDVHLQRSLYPIKLRPNLHTCQA